MMSIQKEENFRLLQFSTKNNSKNRNDTQHHSPEDLPRPSSSSPVFRPNLPLTTRTPNRSSSAITHSRVGFGRIVDRQALVKAFALAHFSSASPDGKVPRAMVLPAH